MIEDQHLGKKRQHFRLQTLAYAVRMAQREGTGGVIVNHHPAANPAVPEVHNLRVIQVYKNVFKVPVQECGIIS